MYRKILVLVIGLVFTTLGGLNWNVAIAAWLGPVFLLYFSKNVKWPGFVFLFLGFCFSSAFSKTAENLSGLFIVSVMTGISYGVIYLIPYVLERFLNKRERKFRSTLVFPSAFVLVEYVFSLKYGMWGSLAITQYLDFNLLQFSSVFGLFGISFIVTWFASIINWILKNQLQVFFIRKGFIIYGSVLVGILLFGGVRCAFFPSDSPLVQAAVIVSETDLHQITDDYQDEMMALVKDYELAIPEAIYSSEGEIGDQLERTMTAALHGAKIVVWNESALILHGRQIDTLLSYVKELCIDYSVYVLLAFVEKDETEMEKPFNNVSILVTPEGKLAWKYLKSNPHPIEALITNRGDSELQVIDTEYGRLGCAICSDLDMTKFISQAGKEGVDIMLVPAFDWADIVPYHSNLAVYTAVQFGYSMIRSNGKGPSVFCDSRGNVFANQNSLLSDSGIVYGEVPIHSSRTLYSRIGDLFVFLLLAFLVFGVVGRLAKADWWD